MWINIQIWVWCFKLLLSYWWIIMCLWMMSRKNNLIQIKTTNNDNVTIAYSREDLVQIGNTVRLNRKLNRLSPETCFKIRTLRLNNIPRKRKQQRKRAGRCRNLAQLGSDPSNLINIRCIPNVKNKVKIGCFTVNSRSLHNKEICVWEFIWKEEMDFGVITETWYKDENWL